MDNHNVLGELQEYVVIGNTLQPLSQSHEKNVLASITTVPNELGQTDYKWSVNNTKILIDCYAKCRKKVGTFDVKNVKMMWQRIAEELNKLNIHVTSNNCHNRWKVLERNYKKYVDNQNKTERGRKFFEFQAEMDEIFGKKKNVHPEILLDSTTVDNTLDEDTEEIITNEEESNDTTKNEEVCKVSAAKLMSPKSLAASSKITEKRKRKITSIEQMRIDKKIYYNERLQIEREKLEEIKKINKLIEIRNEIINKKNCNCQCNST